MAVKVLALVFKIGSNLVCLFKREVTYHNRDKGTYGFSKKMVSREVYINSMMITQNIDFEWFITTVSDSVHEGWVNKDVIKNG